MSETLTPVQTANHDILILAAASLSSAPNLTEAERATRFQIVLHGAMAFRPADPAQTMLASLIMGHHLAIMDGFRDTAVLTLPPAEAARARMVTVAQTRLLLRIARELRIARKEALTWAEAVQPATPAGEPDQAPVDASGQEVLLGRFMSACTETLATLANTDTLTPAAAERVYEALSQAMPPALFAVPGEAQREPQPVATPVTASRAQRRAMMKRRGEFKKTG